MAQAFLPGILVLDIAELHLAVERQPLVRVLGLQMALDLLAEQEFRIGHEVAHLHEVAHGEVGDGVAVGFAFGGVAREHFGPVVIAVLVEQVVEYFTVLVPCVHPFAVERHDGMRGITDQGHLAVDLPRVAPDDSQGALRVAQVLFHKVRDQG